MIVATGSLPNLTAIPGGDSPGVADVVDILSGKVTPGPKVLIVDRLVSRSHQRRRVSGGTGL